MKEYFMASKRNGFSILQNEDYALAEKLWKNPDVSRFISAKGVFTDQEISNRLNLEISNYNNFKVQYWPIFELDSDNFIGCAGLRPGEENTYEIGFHLLPEFWHKGLAYEAAVKVIYYAFNKLSAESLKAGHNPDNHASERLIKKLDFEYIKDEYYKPTGLYHPTYILKKKDS